MLWALGVSLSQVWGSDEADCGPTLQSQPVEVDQGAGAAGSAESARRRVAPEGAAEWYFSWKVTESVPILRAIQAINTAVPISNNPYCHQRKDASHAEGISGFLDSRPAGLRNMGLIGARRQLVGRLYYTWCSECCCKVPAAWRCLTVAAGAEETYCGRRWGPYHVYQIYAARRSGGAHGCWRCRDNELIVKVDYPRLSRNGEAEGDPAVALETLVPEQ